MGSMIKDNLPILAGVGAGLALPALFPALAGAGAAGAGAAGIGTTMPAWAGGAGAGLTGLATGASTTTLPSMLTNPWMRFGMQMFGRDDPRRHLRGPQPQVPFPRDNPGFDWDTATSTPVENPAVDVALSQKMLLPAPPPIITQEYDKPTSRYGWDPHARIIPPTILPVPGGY
jgi:hypothetical protein